MATLVLSVAVPDIDHHLELRASSAATVCLSSPAHGSYAAPDAHSSTHHCLCCVCASQKIAAPPLLHLTPAAQALVLRPARVCGPHFLEVDIHFSGKRGPPFA